MSINGRDASLALWLTVLLTANCGRGKIEDAKDFPSPDGNYVATFMLMNFGATASDCPEVHLHRFDESRGSRGNVFRGFRSFRLKLEWRSSSNLVIYCTPECKVLRHVKQWNDVSIDVIHSANWVLEDRLEYLHEKSAESSSNATPEGAQERP